MKIEPITNKNQINQVFAFVAQKTGSPDDIIELKQYDILSNKKYTYTFETHNKMISNKNCNRM